MTVLITKSAVKKHFKQSNYSHFFNEIYWLEKLKKYKFVPKILNIDYKNYILSLSYEGERISNRNMPKNWQFQLRKILKRLNKSNCFHSDIKPDNLLVNKNKIILIDFSQSIKISDLRKNKFKKKRIFFDEYSINRISLSIQKNIIFSNDLRVLVIWEPSKQSHIEKNINLYKHISIIDKIKVSKNFYKNVFKDRIYWIDQFYNKQVSKKTNKLKKFIFVYIIKSINPVFKINKMIFTNEMRTVDDKIFKFKKFIRKNKSSIIHISDNFEESKRNAISLSRSTNDFPAKYFFSTQQIFNNKNDFFKRLNKSKNLKYVVLRDKKTKKDDLDILVNDYFLFKRIVDCQSYKTKNLALISNSGDPIEDNGFKVSNFIKIKNRKINIDVRFTGDGYFDKKWQENIIKNRKVYKNYYKPDTKNLVYSIIYHIVYHKGYIDLKYFYFLKKKLNLKIINIDILSYILKKFLKSKKYKVTRPTDLTIPITHKLSESTLKEEIERIKNQIRNRNFSGANKMILNILKFQSKFIFFRKDIFLLIILNQLNLIKFRIKNFIFKFVQFNN